MAVLGALWWGSEDAEAQSQPTITITPASRLLHQGDPVTITVSKPTTWANPPIQDSIVTVTTPRDCNYAWRLGTPTPVGNQLTWTATFGAGTAFVKAANQVDSRPDCLTQSNTFITRENDPVNPTDEYVIRLNHQGGNPLLEDAFKVQLTEVLRDDTVFQRTDAIAFISRGHDPNQAVTIQVDHPVRPNYIVTIQNANANGEIRYTLQVPPGWSDPGAREADLGTWTIKLNDPRSAVKAGQDSMSFVIEATQVRADFVVQPAASVPRTGLTGSYIRLTYETSIPGGTERILTSNDFQSTGQRADVEVFQYVEGTGPTQQLPPASTATFVASESSPNYRNWQVDFLSKANDPTGRYVLKVPTNRKDTYNNTFVNAEVFSQPFNLGIAPIQPTFVLKTFNVTRADNNNSLSGDVTLAYPSGRTVSQADLGGPLQVSLYRGNVRLVDSVLVPTDRGSRWEFSGVSGALPPGAPLGPAQLRVVGPAGDAHGNPLDGTRSSETFNILPSSPSAVASFLNETSSAKAFLRGETMRVVVKATYPDGSTLTDQDVRSPGQGGQGQALLRLLPPDGTIRTLDLFYDANAQDFAGSWLATYKTQSTDPVGEWPVVVAITDQYGNRAQQPATSTQSIRVGLVIKSALSTDVVKRSDNLTITASMTLPGRTGAETGQLNVTIKGGGQTLINQAPMTQTAQGGYQFTYPIPFNAPLGTYDVEVRGRSSRDHGLDVVPFDLVSAGVRVQKVRVDPVTVPRLEAATVKFFLQYPDGAPVTRTELPSPIVRLVPALANGTASSPTVPVSFDTNNGEWTARLTTELTTPTGDFKFEISGFDIHQNRIEPFFTRTITIQPAQLTVTNLQPHRLAYDRGEAIRVNAEARYGDGSLATGVKIPVDVMAGVRRLASIDLTYSPSTGVWEGSYPIKLNDDASSAAAQWGLVVRRGSVVDAAGNAGPETDIRDTSGFAVRPTFFSVQVIEQPASGLSIGKSEATIRFTLSTGEGTLVPNVKGISVQLKRGTTVLSETNATVVADGDAYKATLPLSRDLVPGDNYRFVIRGLDDSGNQLREVETQTFSLKSSVKGSPAVPLMMAVVAIAALAVVRRRSA